MHILLLDRPRHDGPLAVGPIADLHEANTLGQRIFAAWPGVYGGFTVVPVMPASEVSAPALRPLQVAVEA